MRTKLAFMNVLSSFLGYIFLLVIGFASQRVFVDALGKEYLGLHGLFNNIMTMLAIAELGFGSAIIANMYKPVAEKNEAEIVALLQFYKKIYRILAGVIFGMGMVIMAFVPYIVGETQIKSNIYILFSFYLMDTVVSYFVTYKRSILYANQKSYYTNIIHTVFVVTMNLLQMAILILFKNYYVYLMLRVLFRFLENLCINAIANKKYPYINTKEIYPLGRDIRNDIKKKVSGLLFHKIGTFVVLGSDNIIISMLPNLGIVFVGLYSNYSMIINQLNTIIGQIFSSVTASVGNLLVEGNKEKSYDVFKKMFLVNIWLYLYIAISFYYISFPFVELWMGSDFILSERVVLVLAVNIFVNGIRTSFGTFKDAAGIFYEDRYVPVIECLVNIIVSVVLGYKMGLAGIFIGTISSNMVLFCYSFPKFVYKGILGADLGQYARDVLGSVVLFAISFLATHMVISLFVLSSAVLQLAVDFLICLTVPNALMFAFTCKTKEFGYFVGFIKRRKGV